MWTTRNRDWARGLRAPVVLLIALAMFAGFASTAEARKKAPVDPAAVAAAFDAAIDALVDDTETKFESLKLGMSAEIDAAVDKGSAKQALRVQSRYESRIRKLQRKQQNTLAKLLAKTRKSLLRVEGDPVELSQVEDLAAELAAEIDAATEDTSDLLGRLIFDAMIQLAAAEAATP